MEKKSKLLISIFILGIIIVLLQINMSVANSEANYQKMLADYKQNNTNLKEIELDLADAKRTYQQSEENVKTASSSWSNLVDVFNRMGKEITDQMKFNTVMQRSIALEKAKITLNQQEISAKTKQDNQYILLRQSYLNYWQAATNVESLEMHYKIAELTKTKNQLLFEQGKISLHDYNISQINAIESENKLKTAKRALLEKQQSLNSFIGVNLNTTYEPNIWEKQEKLIDNQVKNYVDQALAERLDIIMLEDQIVMNQLNIDTYDKYFTYNSMSDKMQESYDDLKENNYYLELELNQKKTQVEKEIREAYLDLKYEEYKIETILNKRNDVNNEYLKVKEQYNSGSVTQIELLQAELNYSENQSNYLMSIYDYNTKIFKFNCLSNSGLNIITSSNSQALNNVQGGRR